MRHTLHWRFNFWAKLHLIGSFAKTVNYPRKWCSKCNLGQLNFENIPFEIPVEIIRISTEIFRNNRIFFSNSPEIFRIKNRLFEFHYKFYGFQMK